MTEDIVIRAEGLGKNYMIGHEAQRERYVALRDVIARGARSAFRKATDIAKGRIVVPGDEMEEFWALKDINFEVKRGEVLGIIGRNGAGKSTLLKILSRITEPTEGRVTIKGRVASLLEVGTGFHPELTGRENIYLNGAILGMTRSEIKRKFDEIVAFAEVEKFLDTPVKRYSSGMYVRLAFAVAAHLEPEILIVDEVLAVGDAEFQKKCLGKIGEVANGGRTVLFVSHNMAAVASLCTNAMLLHCGEIQVDDTVDKCLAIYFEAKEGASRLEGKQVEVEANVTDETVNGSPAVSLQFDITLRGPLVSPNLGIGISDAEGRRLVTLLSETSSLLPSLDSDQKLSLQLKTEPVRLAPGQLSVKVALEDMGTSTEAYEDAFQLIVPEYSPFLSAPHTRPRGPLLLKHDLTILSDEVRCVDTQ